MKGKGRIICLGLAVMLIVGILGGTALTQDRPSNVVSTDVVSLVQGVINLQYEKVNPGMSFYGAPFVGFGGGVTAIGATAGIKKYFQPTAPEGFWFGGFGLLEYISLIGGSITTVGGGGNVGYKYFITDELTIEGSIGLAYAYILGWGGAFGAVYGINVGYAF